MSDKVDVYVHIVAPTPSPAPSSNSGGVVEALASLFPSPSTSGTPSSSNNDDRWNESSND